MKVAIIGAGIVGLYLAWKLSEKGHKVTVFEKKDKIGKECCSGLFSERILKFIPQSQNLIQNQINFALIHFPRRTIRVDFAQKFFIMSHVDLDRLVVGLAEKAGAEIVLNHAIKSLPRDFEKIIGCDGALSKTRQCLGLKNPQFRLGIQKLITQEDFSNMVEVWPTPGGFTWEIPRGESVERGAIVSIKKVKNFPTLEYESFGLIPQGLIIPKNKDITLCGDAAGLTKPWSGGGVIWGLTAADLLLKNFPDLLKYRVAVKKNFLPQILLSKIATKVIYFLGFKIPWLLPKKIKIDGDFFF